MFLTENKHEGSNKDSKLNVEWIGMQILLKRDN